MIIGTAKSWFAHFFFDFFEKNIVKTALHEKGKLCTVAEGFWVGKLQGPQGMLWKIPTCMSYFFALDTKWPRFLLFALYSNLNPVDVPYPLEWKWKKSWLLEEILLDGAE